MLKPLTSFRFIAALMVFLFHTGGFFANNAMGHAGVQFFFVLSGFILTYSCRDKFQTLQISQLKNFYAARIAKIYPVHVLTFLISVPLVLLYFNPQGFYLLKLAIISSINLLLIQSYIPSSANSFNNVSWSLSVEMFFYMAFPFLLFLFKKIGLFKKTTTSLIIAASIFTILFSINNAFPDSNNKMVWLLNIFPLARIFEFIIGILMGMIFIEKRNKYHILFGEIELIVLLTVPVWFYMATFINLPTMRGMYFVPIWALLIYTFAHGSGKISKILSNKTFLFLGEISFSFYMIHFLVIYYLEFLHLVNVLNDILAFTISLILSSLMYWFYEEPLRKLIRRRNVSEPSYITQKETLSVHKVG